jgi:glycine betaine/proline transport system substrate-binding protein
MIGFSSLRVSGLRRTGAHRLWVLLASTIVAVAVGIASHAQAAGLPGNGITITPCTSLSIEGLFKELILLKGLEKLGYSTNMPRTLTVPVEHQAAASGDCTYSFDHWVPMHDSFLANIKDQTIIIGPVVKGAIQGYLIDKKSADKYGITNLEQFKDPKIAKVFDTKGDGKATLCCVTPGWGAEKVVNHELDAIGLRTTVDLGEGEYVPLISDVVARFRRGEPVFFYTWTPWWLLGELKPGVETVWLNVDPKYCLQPCGTSTTGFSVNDISIVANRNFMDKNPSAKAFLQAVQIPIDDLNAENLLMQNGEDKEPDVERHVNAWIANNQATFDSWVAKGMAAAQ